MADNTSTSGTSREQLEEEKVVDLRKQAKDQGISGSSGMKKAELVDALVGASTNDAADGSDTSSGGGSSDSSSGAGPDGGHVRTGSESSKTLKYSQEITDPDQDPERPGRSLVTTSHDVIRQWAEERGGRPATVEGTEHGNRLGVLRFDFGDKTDRLREVSWDEWFATFDERRLNFIYQEERTDGRQSTFFRLENPDREDA